MPSALVAPTSESELSFQLLCSNVALNTLQDRAEGSWSSWQVLQKNRPSLAEVLPKLLGKKDSQQLEVYVPIKGNGGEHFVMTSARHSQGVLLSFTNISHIKKRAYHDVLTALPNRRAFEERADEILSLAKRKAWKVSLLYLDVNNFKDVNDHYGHSVGDAFLKELASRLQLVSRREEPFSRIGGDEFALLLLNASLQDASVVAERVLKSLKKPFIKDEINIPIAVSIGLAEGSGNQSLDMILNQADKAMYRAKAVKAEGSEIQTL